MQGQRHSHRAGAFGDQPEHINSLALFRPPQCDPMPRMAVCYPAVAAENKLCASYGLVLEAGRPAFKK